MTNATAQQADAIFRIGPETLVARSSTIVAGPVSDYSKRILSFAEPASEGVALKWEVSGQLVDLRVLKGRPPGGAVRFSRAEQSMFVPRDPSVPDWELQYGDLSADDHAVLFIAIGPAMELLNVLPSGADERDLAALVEDIVVIQAIDDPEKRLRQWLSYLESTGHVEGRKAALRTLIHTPVAWSDLAPVLERLLVQPALGADVRVFIFGIVAFAVTENPGWADQPEVTEFLCQMFLAEQDADLALQHVLSMKRILGRTYDETARRMRRPVGERVLDCLRLREARGPLAPALEDQYRQIRASFPGLF